MDENIKLKQNNIMRRYSQSCKCGNHSFIYTIPVKLDERIISLLTPLGVPAFDFSKTSILKIENSTLIITGIRRLREIRFVLKKEITSILDAFEDALIKYVKIAEKK
jgi:hypothetical protein